MSGGADGTVYPILSDNLGTPRVVLDPSNGDRRWAWTAKEAFGLQSPNENPDSVAGGSFTFDARRPGQFLDAETGLFHNGFRDYDAKTGRYVESDPLGLGAGWNTYGYAEGAPPNWFDSLGLRVKGTTRGMDALVQGSLFDLGKKSPYAAKLIREIQDDDFTYPVGRDAVNATEVNRYGIVSWWNPDIALGFNMGCGAVSM